MLRDEELPPLPSFPGAHTPHLGYQIETAMREYGRAVEKAAYERAAQECEKRAGPIETYNRSYPHYLECADAIRSLMKEQPK